MLQRPHYYYKRTLGRNGRSEVTLQHRRKMLIVKLWPQKRWNYLRPESKALGQVSRGVSATWQIQIHVLPMSIWGASVPVGPTLEIWTYHTISLSFGTWDDYKPATGPTRIEVGRVLYLLWLNHAAQVEMSTVIPVINQSVLYVDQFIWRKELLHTSRGLY